jgi:L-lactate dehydrogenase complex protein LldG
MEGTAMTSRDEILASIRVRKTVAAPRPAPYSAPKTEGDLAEAFAQRLSLWHAEVRTLNGMDEVPAAIADVLRGRNMAAEVHIPPDSDLALDLPNVEIKRTPPGPFDAAVTEAPFAIAETGTLAYAAGKGTPASWHFRPMLEIAILRADRVVAEFEDVLRALEAKGGLPATLNLVSGPSRTGDIEQTMELGAHGPKALVVLVVRA